jgi:hypothetical protein
MSGKRDILKRRNYHLKGVVGMFLLSFLFSFPSFSQKLPLDITEEQYALLNTHFSSQKNKRIRIHYQLIGESTWTRYALKEMDSRGIQFCEFKDEELPQTLTDLPALGAGLATKQLKKKALDFNLRFSKKVDDEKLTYIYEPIIHKNYGLFQVKTPEYISIFVYKREDLVSWKMACRIDIYYPIVCEGAMINFPFGS